MPDKKRLVLLGIDGLDPNVAERLISQGKLPNFQRLAESGGYARLATTNPAQSPVAWTTLATGVGPGRHGVFDFLKPVPKKMSIDLAIIKPRRGPGGAPAFDRVREADAFWDLTSAAGIATSIIRWPVTFPAEDVTGRFISGLGTPDIQGSLGRYTYFTTRGVAPDDKNPRNVRKLTKKGRCLLGEIEGPMVAGLTGVRPAAVPFELEPRGRTEATLRLRQAKPVLLREGQWSPWLRLEFGVGRGRTVSGIVKCLLLHVSDEDCRLYVSPIEIDPRSPCFDISSPPGFAAELAEELGPFHTLGMTEDTKGVTDRRFEPEHFLQTCDEVLRERIFMLNRELDLLPDRGVLAVVFDTLDRVQHLFWAAEDPTHPIADDAWRAKWGGVIEDFYVRMDGIVGSVLQRIGPDAALLVFSDHGFTSFRRAVHLNRWLTEQGYMTAELDAEDAATSLFRTVDWRRTRAYACGFGGIYLNLRGREAKGIVSRGAEALVLRCELAWRIAEELRDAECDARPIRQAFVCEEIFSGPLMGRAPDVFVGFEPGYRASWQTALGGGLRALVEENAKPWCGDHLVHADCVPGVLFSSEPIQQPRPSVADICPTVLAHFGLDIPAALTGAPILPVDV